jgi:hypothetical protein
MCLYLLIYTVRPCLIHTFHTLPCHAHAMLRLCRYSQGHSTAISTAVLCCGLEKNGMVGAWHGKCESDTAALYKSNGRHLLKPLSARHGRGTACHVWIGLLETLQTALCCLRVIRLDYVPKSRAQLRLWSGRCDRDGRVSPRGGTMVVVGGGGQSNILNGKNWFSALNKFDISERYKMRWLWFFEVHHFRYGRPTYFVGISEQTAFISLYSINWLVFL